MCTNKRGMPRSNTSKSSINVANIGRMAIPSGHNFATCYIDLCKQQRLRPLAIICGTLPHSLDFTTDRVKMDDWAPILNSLSLDRSLKSVSVRSRYQCRKPLENISSIGKTRKLGKQPMVLSRYLLEWLSHSVAQCVRNSPALTCLQLEGVPLPADCLAALCVGLSSTKTLEHLSLRRCYIGDNCCAMICKTIADIQSIKSLNLSQCDLSSNCGAALASALSRQKLLLYHDTWKESLRYREPNFEAMAGLRRLTLNGNPHLGNLAATQIIDAIQDSLWLKALDLQNCGLTDTVGNKIIELLDHNKTLDVIDVRLNSNLDDNIVQDIFKRLEINNIGCRLEYRLSSLTLKDSRAVSEGTNDKCRNNPSEINCLTRPKSAIVRNVKKFSQLNTPQTINSTSNVGKKMKTRLSLPTSSSIQKSSNKIPMPDGKSSKVSLHLDLQSCIPSAVNSNSWKVNRVKINKLQNDKSMVNNICDKDKKTKVSINTRTMMKFDDILRQLSDAKVEREKLLMATQSMERELKEERAQREAGETKLWTMQRNLIDLKSALREKELESRGCLLVNQQSLDEISMTFEQLLNVLDDLSKNSSATRTRDDDDKTYSNIRQRIALLIRKTKSEKLHREFNETKSTTKFNKSANDVRNSSSIISPIHFDKNIGDNLDTVTINMSINENNLRQEKMKTIFSPCERARAIFAQVINGDVILNLDSDVS